MAAMPVLFRVDMLRKCAIDPPAILQRLCARSRGQLYRGLRGDWDNVAGLTGPARVACDADRCPLCWHYQPAIKTHANPDPA
jgi:hypothetical protein